MSKEDKISKEICESLKRMINESNYFNYNVHIEPKKKIFIGTTCGICENREGNKVVNLFFQSAEQDIVVYLRDNENKYRFEGKDFFKKYTKSLTNDEVLIPLIIFETKYENVITHTVRQYSEIARMIKNIFPFCMYNLLLINIKPNASNLAPDRIYMSSKYFDKVIRKEDYAQNNALELNSKIFMIIKERLEYLKNERHFGFGELL